MAKRPNLAEIAAAAGSARSAPPVATVPETAANTTKPAARRGQVKVRGPGIRQVAGNFPEEVSWQLRQLALERRTTVQGLLAEALNDLFQKHGKPEIVSSGPS